MSKGKRKKQGRPRIVHSTFDLTDYTELIQQVDARIITLETLQALFLNLDNLAERTGRTISVHPVSRREFTREIPRGMARRSARASMTRASTRSLSHEARERIRQGQFRRWKKVRALKQLQSQ